MPIRRRRFAPRRRRRLVRRTTRTSRRRTTMSYRRRKATNSLVYRGIGQSTGVPPTLRIRHEFYVNKDSVATSGIFDVTNYRGNSIYDPEVAAGGESANLFSNLGALYEHYRVTSSSISVACVNLEATRPFILTVTPKRYEATSLTNYRAEQHEQYCKWRYLLPVSYSGKTTWIRHRMSTKKIMDCKDIKDIPTLSGSNGADPAAQWKWSVGVQDFAGTTDVHYQLRVRIIYNVTWYNPINQAS